MTIPIGVRGICMCLAQHRDETVSVNQCDEEVIVRCYVRTSIWNKFVQDSLHIEINILIGMSVSREKRTLARYF